METQFEGKKLLILGANPETIPLVQIANRMGVKTIVTSNRKNDPAKAYAWKACDVDGLDVEGLVNLAKNEAVDGVLVGVADMLVAVYSKVCEKLGFPCYASKDVVDIFSNKDIFKETCEKYGVKGIPQYKLDLPFEQSDLNKIKYPVMVKPVDGYSGLGMTVVYSENELKPAVEKALNISRNKRFIVERFMTCEDVAVYYTFKDGNCSISCVFDRYTTNNQPGLSKVNMGSIYPSRHLDDYLRNMHPNAVKMFKEIGIKNGVLLMQAFYEDGEFYVYDPGFRLQGEAPHLLMKVVNGFDQRELLIKYALSGSEGDINLKKQDDVCFRGKAAATLWVLLKEGQIKSIEGMSDISYDPRIIENVQRLYEEDIVEPSWIGTEKQVMTRLYFVCNNKKELHDTILEYENKIKVFDANGNNMIVEWLDPEKIIGE